MLLTQVQGQEGLSHLFEFKVDLLAPTTEPVVFDQILGASVTIQLNIPGSSKRSINGIVNSFTQGERVRSAEGQVSFLRYHASVVPRLWLLTRRSQSRIFLDLSVPDILLEILKKEWQLDVVARITEHFDPRIRCVQYRETDFAFVSRLMEEEGLHYFFEHTDKGHQLVLSDAKTKPASLPEPSQLRYTEQEGSLQEVGCVYHWKKTQQLQACKVTLWDHCFELPGQHLEADTEIETSVSAGKAKHKLNLQQTINGVAMLENYDYPGRYAQRYDGINSNGGEQPSNLPKIFDDNKRTTQIRAQQEAVQALTIQGTSNLGHLVPGTQFKLEHHFDADDAYLLTQVTHHASIEGTYLGNDHVDLQYENEFTCLPLTLPYCPPSVTPRPTVKGSQTATVVGPEGQVVYCDKYGRIKVQFHWDRTDFKGGSSKHILHNSSGWIRVSQAWAGQSFGSIFLPRIGQEVVVDFLDGDPDRPIVTGSVYNAEQLPPFELPDYQTHSGLRTRSREGDNTEFSQLTFEDFKGGEHVHLHSQRDMTHSTENDLVQNIAQAHRVNIGSMGVRQVGALPGVDHSYWIGKDNAVGGVPSSDSSQGSGSGGGSGTFYSISPSDLSSGWAGDLDAGDPVGIVIQANGLEGTDGEVVVLGTAKASLIGGDQAYVQCTTLEEVEGKVTIDCGAEGTISMQSGLTQEPNSLLLNPEGIAITSALEVKTTVEENSITLNPAEIALAAGLSSINMTPEGITLSCGPCSIAITPEGITISAPTVTLSGDAAVSISGATVSIGP